MTTVSPALEKHLASATYDCVVIGAGLRLPPKGLSIFERVVNAVHKSVPGSAIAFNTRPEDTAEAARALAVGRPWRSVSFLRGTVAHGRASAVGLASAYRPPRDRTPLLPF